MITFSFIAFGICLIVLAVGFCLGENTARRRFEKLIKSRIDELEKKIKEKKNG